MAGHKLEAAAKGYFELKKILEIEENMSNVKCEENVTYKVTVREDDSVTSLGRQIRGRIIDMYVNKDPKIALQAYTEVMELNPGKRVEIETETYISTRDRQTISPEELQRLASQE